MWIYNCEWNGWIFCISCMICKDLKYFERFQSNNLIEKILADHGYLNNCMRKTYKIERDK